MTVIDLFGIKFGVPEGKTFYCEGYTVSKYADGSISINPIPGVENRKFGLYNKPDAIIRNNNLINYTGK